MNPNLYRAAVIGVGAATPRTWAKGGGHKIGYIHAENLRKLPQVALTSAADINPGNLSAFQAEFGLSSGYLDYREMLARERLDLVTIGTYVGLHARMVIDCARAGVKVILCEKPFVSSPAELVAIDDVLRETGATLGIAHMRRMSHTFKTARKLLADGMIGQPVLFAGGLGGWDMSEFGSHWIDLMRFLHGDLPVISVMGQVRLRDGFGYGHRMEDHAVAIFEFADGARGLVDGGRNLVPGCEGGGWDIRVTGTAGMLAISETKHVILFNQEGRHKFDTPEAGTEWTEIFSSLITEQEGGEISPVSLQRCRQTAEIQLGCYLSCLLRDRVDLPLAEQLTKIDRWPLDLLAESENLIKH